jgi:dTDP-4-amino-4,6-dideoxygalactose transaminase/nucleoside-diphosphate-sugar epimerase
MVSSLDDGDLPVLRLMSDMCRAPVLVTGGGGFLGAHLALALRKREREVVVLDVAACPEELASEPGVTFVRGDVRDTALVDSLVARVSAVLHMAAIVGVDEYLRRPDEVLDVGILGSRAVLTACLREQRPVVLASTSEVYGKNPDDLREDADAVLGPLDRPRWSYAIAKLAAEQWAHALARRGLRHLTIRYFNVYGPGLDAPGRGRVLAKMIGAVQRGEPIPLVDGGEATRSLCHVDDAVEATLRLAELLERDDALRGRTFNIGRREPVTMRQLAEAVIRITGHAAGTVDVSGSEAFGPGFDEITTRVPDVDALREATGFTADIDLEAGLRSTLATYGLLSSRPPASPPPAQRTPWVRPFFDPDAALLGRIRGSLASGRVTNGGPIVEELEREVSRWLGVDGAIAVSTGTDALTLAALALGLRGRFVLPAFTYAATLSSLEILGLTPVFCEVDAETWTLDPSALAQVLASTDDVAAVVAVNVYGVPPDLAALGRLCQEHRVRLIYDDAHGFGTIDRGLRVPTEPDVVTFSLHATKVLTAIEGGLVVARDPALARDLRRLRTHGLAADPLRSTPGLNAKMDELRAAVALHALARIDGTLARRTEYAERLRRRASSCSRGPAVGGHAAGPAGPSLQVQRIPPSVQSNHQNFSVVLDGDPAPDVPATMARLATSGVESRRYFHPALHRLARFPGAPPSLPRTERLADRILSLPLHGRMSEADLIRVERGLDLLAGHRG